MDSTRAWLQGKEVFPIHQLSQCEHVFSINQSLDITEQCCQCPIRIQRKSSAVQHCDLVTLLFFEANEGMEVGPEILAWW